LLTFDHQIETKYFNGVMPHIWNFNLQTTYQYVEIETEAPMDAILHHNVNMHTSATDVMQQATQHTCVLKSQQKTIEHQRLE